MKMINDEKKMRIIYIAAFLALLIIEVLIAKFVHDSFIRPYVGDMLVVVVVYCFVRIIIPCRCRLLPLYVYVFAAGVEVLQYFQLVKKLGLQGNAFLRILIGSTYDIKDIGCYAIGCVILGGYEFIIRKRGCFKWN